MPRKRHHKPIVLTDDERRTLEQWTRRPTTAQRLALRSRMVLACAEGLTNRAVAKRLRVSSNSVCKWRERFRARRLPGLTDEPRPGAAAPADASGHPGGPDPRLYPPWHDLAVRGVGRRERQSDWAVSSTASSPGVSEIP